MPPIENNWEIWKDRYKRNKDVYHDSGEVPMHQEMAKMRWRAFGHMLRLPPTAPCQLAMQYYFEIPYNAKKFSGRKRMTLPVKIDEDITTHTMNNETLPGNVNGFKNLADLIKLREIAEDRETWKKLTEIVSVDVQGDGCTLSKAVKVQ